MTRGVWIVAACCRDYYCGCGVGHLLGIFEDATTAQLAVEEASKRDRWFEVATVMVPINRLADESYE